MPGTAHVKRQNTLNLRIRTEGAYCRFAHRETGTFVRRRPVWESMKRGESLSRAQTRVRTRLLRPRTGPRPVQREPVSTRRKTRQSEKQNTPPGSPPLKDSEGSETGYEKGNDIWASLKALTPEIDEWIADNRPAYDDRQEKFSVHELAAIFSSANFKPTDLTDYLRFFDKTTVSSVINENIHSSPPAIFWAVVTNSVEAVSLCLNWGSDPNSEFKSQWLPTPFPLLAFAILRGTAERDTTELVRLLLASGADPSVVPECLYVPYEQVDEVEETGAQRVSRPSWCTDYYFQWLKTALNVSQKYWLRKSKYLPKRTSRIQQVSRLYNCKPLLQVPFCLIGQDIGTENIVLEAMGYMLSATGQQKPLVLLFAGPSGHGKTELARTMGRLMSRDFVAVDCTEINFSTDLFGAGASYRNHEDGAALNNFLTARSGQQCIVFLDEFEKMPASIFNSFLIMWDEGKYRDRRSTDRYVDVRKVIWILASNVADHVIQDFYSRNIDILSSPMTADKSVLDRVLKNLKRSITTQVLKPRFGLPLTGRISDIIPFFPFSPGEQAVVAHKYLLDLHKTLASDIHVDKPELLRHITVSVENTARVCKHLVDNEGYDRENGARSIAKTVREKVTKPLIKRWLLCDAPEVADADNEKPKERYTVAIRQLGEADDEVVVIRENANAQ